MRDDLIAALRAQRPEIRRRWRDLLFAEKATSPLANPAALVHLIDWTLEEVERALLTPAHRHRLGRAASRAGSRDPAACEQNPFLAHFAAAEQALREALILAQTSVSQLTTAERDLSLVELDLALHVVAEHEIQAFSAVCQHRAPETAGAANSA